MRKENRLANLMKRDEILRNHVTESGFFAFLMLMIFGPLSILMDLLNKEISSDMAKYGFKLIGLVFLVFVCTLFMVTKAKKEYFTQRAVRIVTLVASIIVGIKLYTEGLELWVFLVGWVVMSFVIYKAVKYIFEDISKSHPYF